MKTIILVLAIALLPLTSSASDLLTFYINSTTRAEQCAKHYPIKSIVAGLTEMTASPNDSQILKHFLSTGSLKSNSPSVPERLQKECKEIASGVVLGVGEAAAKRLNVSLHPSIKNRESTCMSNYMMNETLAPLVPFQSAYEASEVESFQPFADSFLSTGNVSARPGQTSQPKMAQTCGIMLTGAIASFYAQLISEAKGGVADDLATAVVKMIDPTAVLQKVLPAEDSTNGSATESIK